MRTVVRLRNVALESVNSLDSAHGRISIGQWLRQSADLTIQLLKAQSLPLGLMFLISTFLNLQIEESIQASKATQPDARLDLQVFLAALDFVEGILLLLFLSYGIVKCRKLNNSGLSSQPFSTPYLQTFFAEYFRMLAQILLYGLLLLLPGFFRYAQLIFVPFVALFSELYRQDKVDALRASRLLTKGQMGRILTVLFFTVSLTLGLEFGPHLSEFAQAIPLRVLTQLLIYFIAVASFALIFILFEASIDRLQPEEN